MLCLQDFPFGVSFNGGINCPSKQRSLNICYGFSDWQISIDRGWGFVSFFCGKFYLDLNWAFLLYQIKILKGEKF